MGWGLGLPSRRGEGGFWRTSGHMAGLMVTSQAFSSEISRINIISEAILKKGNCIRIDLWWFTVNHTSPVEITHPPAQVHPPCHLSSFLSLSLSTGLEPGSCTARTFYLRAFSFTPAVTTNYSTRLPPGLAREYWLYINLPSNFS